VEVVGAANEQIDAISHGGELLLHRKHGTKP